MEADERRDPEGRASCPIERFSAFLLMNPVLAGPFMTTCSPSISVSSIMTMASAPAGRVAPVMILQAWPAPISGGLPPPAWLVPTISSLAPSSSQSDTRTAKPSMAELSNPGSSTLEISGTAVTLPRASSIDTLSVRLDRGLVREIWIASSSDTPVSMALHAWLGSSVLPLWYRCV